MRARRMDQGHQCLELRRIARRSLWQRRQEERQHDRTDERWHRGRRDAEAPAAWPSTSSKCTAPTDASVKLQLQWVTQAQFAGYFAAVDKGFYRGRRALTSTSLEGGVDIPPQNAPRAGAV